MCTAGIDQNSGLFHYCLLGGSRLLARGQRGQAGWDILGFDMHTHTGVKVGRH